MTANNALCIAGKKSGPARPLRSRAMMICSRSFAALADLGLLLNRKESRAILLAFKNALEQTRLFVIREAHGDLLAEEAGDHILVGFRDVAAVDMDRPAA